MVTHGAVNITAQRFIYIVFKLDMSVVIYTYTVLILDAEAGKHPQQNHQLYMKNITAYFSQFAFILYNM